MISTTRVGPEELILDISYACNLSCQTCLCPQIDQAKNKPVLSIETAFRTISEFAKIGGQRLALFGGEPLLVPYVYDVITYAHKLGLNISITTNAIAAKSAHN